MWLHWCETFFFWSNIGVKHYLLRVQMKHLYLRPHQYHIIDLFYGVESGHFVWLWYLGSSFKLQQLHFHPKVLVKPNRNTFFNRKTETLSRVIWWTVSILYNSKLWKIGNTISPPFMNISFFPPCASSWSVVLSCILFYITWNFNICSDGPRVKNGKFVITAPKWLDADSSAYLKLIILALNRRKISYLIWLFQYVDLAFAFGEPISLQLLQAIKDSWVSIAVFSKDYAAFTGCLDDMAAIAERHEEFKIRMRELWGLWLDQLKK